MSDQLTALETVIGIKPYLWQTRLFSDFMDGGIPDALDIPTGLGKTSVIGIWLAARAVGGKVPRRLVYVVDRRAVVDQASGEAERLRKRLKDALNGSVTADIAETWRRNLGLDRDELPVSTLRGQYADNRLWLENPARSAIIVGTVDMVGSRMLFEGYGVSTRMRPVHAALLANDTLVVLDEAHLVPPFQHLMRSVSGFDRPVPVPPLKLLASSATGWVRQGDSAFRLQPGDESDEPPVKARLHAPKKLRLHDTANLAQALADRAFELGKTGQRVLVFCNSRDKLARVVAEDLRKRCARVWKDAPTTVLLVGARRVNERRLLTNDPVFRRFVPGQEQQPTEVPAFLVATSAGEVGVDLDADHMVCDLVAWERMVQRLGRVNRSGRPEPAIVDVFAAVPKDDAEDEVADRIDILRAPFESDAWPVGEDGRRQAGPGALRSLQADPAFAALTLAATTREPLRPELSRALVDAWAMTSLEQHTGRPKVEPWLRGWVERVPQARIVWRSELPVRNGRPDPKLLSEFFEALPPHLSEILETEHNRVAELLNKRSAVVSGLPDDATVAVLLDARGGLLKQLNLGQLKKIKAEDLTGQTVVVDARLGGLSADGLLDLDVAAPPSTFDSGSESEWEQQVGRRLRKVAPDSEFDGWVREAGWPVTLNEASEESEEWQVERLVEAVTEGDAARLRVPQALQPHLDAAAEEADRIASALELDEAYRRMIREAAALHDCGKDRELWQTAMGAPQPGRPFAKTDGRRANGRALGGYRHEFGSLHDAEDRLSAIPEDLRDLARHLIAAHHGWARPMIAPLDPAEPPSMAAERSQAAALRFAQLQRHWGPWGLAWWESLLRAADWAASSRLSEAKATGEKA